jgi:PAS domain S-box-containing protein
MDRNGSDAAEALRRPDEPRPLSRDPQGSAGPPGEPVLLPDERRVREEAWRQAEARLEEALRQARALRLHFQNLFESATDGSLVTDRSGLIREASHSAAELLRVRREFLPGKPLGLFVAEPERQEFYGRLARLRQWSDPGERWEARLQPRAGEPVSVVLEVSPLPAGEGEGFRWLLRDVSLLRRAEQALRAEKSFGDTLIDMVEGLILVVDAVGRILRANPAAQALVGGTAWELQGQDWSAVFLAEPERPQGRRMLRQALSQGRSDGGIHEVVSPDGRRRAVAWTARALTAVSPGGPAAVLFGHDVTELQAAQRQALRAERLAAIGQMVAGLAHESRNALQRTEACLERLAWRLHDQPEALDLLRRAQGAQADLLRLYDDVRSYAAPVRLTFAPCDLGEAWREAWGHAVAVLTGKEAALQEDAADTDLACQADRFRLVQVFRNLFDNALSASPEPVRVTVTCRPADLDGRPALRVAVRDDGPGLPPGQRAHLFEPFYTTKVKGTGLGLALVKRLVEAHGGQVAAAATPPPGAEIVLTLPRRQP